MPVLPDVGSKMVAPGASSPSFSACSIMKNAARSLTDPVGLRSSSFAHSRTSGASDSRQHRHRVAVLHRRLQPAEETHVFVVEVDVDEAPQPGSFHQALAQAAVPGVKVAEEFGEGGTGTLDRLGATGVGAQDGRDTDLDGHERRSWV